MARERTFKGRRHLQLYWHQSTRIFTWITSCLVFRVADNVVQLCVFGQVLLFVLLVPLRNRFFLYRSHITPERTVFVFAVCCIFLKRQPFFVFASDFQRSSREQRNGSTLLAPPLYGKMTATHAIKESLMMINGDTHTDSSFPLTASLPPDSCHLGELDTAFCFFLLIFCFQTIFGGRWRKQRLPTCPPDQLL